MHNKKILLLVLLAAAILGAVVLWNQVRTPSKVLNQLSQSGVKRDAPKGQLISGFPQVLKPSGVAVVNDSFSISYPSYNQYSAVFQTDLSVSAAYNQYLDYLKANGYKILNQGTDKNTAHIYGTKTGSDVNVTINSVAGKTQVNIGYLNKQS